MLLGEWITLERCAGAAAAAAAPGVPPQQLQIGIGREATASQHLQWLTGGGWDRGSGSQRVLRVARAHSFS